MRSIISTKTIFCVRKNGLLTTTHSPPSLKEAVYGLHQTPFGAVGIIVQGPFLLGLYFQENNAHSLHSDVCKIYPGYALHEDLQRTAPWLSRVLKGAPVDFKVYGTPFQISVWSKLLEIPKGGIWTYTKLAQTIGHPKAARAVGNALNRNPLPIVIPCHRVLPKDGSLGGYRWGRHFKHALLRQEREGR